MLVCEECGVNLEIMGTHVPGCSNYVLEDHEKALQDAEDKVLDGIDAWNAVMDAASERGIIMAKNMLKGYLIESGVTPPEEFDQALIDVLTISSWAGVLSAVQVFSEQEFIDRRAVIRFTKGALNFDE